MTIQELKDRKLILFEVIAGSKSFGLDTPESDTDIKGVFYLPKDMFFGLKYIPQVSNETNDIVYYELGRYIELLTKNNPNILEILATPTELILYRNPIMEKIAITDFLSKMCKDTFTGYATTQIKKARGLNKKFTNPIPKERKSPLDFCYILKSYNPVALDNWLQKNGLRQEDCGVVNIAHSKDVFAVFTDTSGTLGYNGIIRDGKSNEVLLSSIPAGEAERAYMYFNKDAYSNYCKEYREYWGWVEKRNDNRYAKNTENGKQYDSKNMMHTIRLLQSALEILDRGRLTIKVPNRDELFTIKKGILEYKDILILVDKLLDKTEMAAKISTLPDKPDIQKATKLLVDIRTELYK